MVGYLSQSTSSITSMLETNKFQVDYLSFTYYKKK